jgi:hypothetical protein
VEVQKGVREAAVEVQEGVWEAAVVSLIEPTILETRIACHCVWVRG